MSGKYMITKKLILPTMTMIILSSMLFGCSAASQEESLNILQQSSQVELEYQVPEYDTITSDTNKNKSDVKLSPWLQLSSLETHPELRAAFDKHFEITGTAGNKEGVIYYNTDTEKNDQNVTLFMMLKNKAVNVAFIAEEDLKALAEMAAKEYEDIEADDQSAAYAAINAYFELLPDQTAGSFDGQASLSRAQTMTLLMRATTPANEAQAPEANKDFTSAVGDNKYTNFAAPMNEYTYLNTSNGLNENRFNAVMTRGEYICMVTNLLISDYKALLEKEQAHDLYADNEVTLSVVKDAGNISIEEAMLEAEKGVPTDMYNTFKTALQYGLITESMVQAKDKDWEDAITKSEALHLFIQMGSNYTREAANILLNNSYTSPEQLSQEEFNSKEQKALRKFAETLPGDEANLNIRLTRWAQSQGADCMLGWTMVFENGKGAGSEPTYGVYMNPDSPLYGTIYHVGDILPNGTRLDGTREENDALSAQKLVEKLEEEGMIKVDPETGEKYIQIGGDD